MRFLYLAALFSFYNFPARANPVSDEQITHAYEAEFLSANPPRIIPSLEGTERAHLALDAAENLLAAGRADSLALFEWRELAPADQARWFRLGGVASEEDLSANLANAAPSAALLYELLALEPKLRTPRGTELLRWIENTFPAESLDWRARKARTFSPPSADAIRSLYFDATDSAHFQNGAYANKPRLFLFCRHDRNYHCLLTLKDKDGNPVRDGANLWTQKGLGLSGYGKPFNERLGNTPQGVHLVDSVMPDADDFADYGAYRRMILEFPPASQNETEMRRLLPRGALATDWWKESAIARDIGRGELRIHGTGSRNNRPDLAMYPFIATIGCVAQLELAYDGVTYIDQRHLLDHVMQAQGLAPTYANEPAIRALLYVIDIDDKKANVTAADLARLGIN
jgi:hypothetical protein